MKQMKVLSALGLLALAGAAHAEVTSSIAVVSDYDFRGFTQTNNKPALQASIDYAHESGWYLGTWASNVDFNTDPNVTGVPAPQTEVDLYTGFSGSAGDFGWDAGIVYYTYNGASGLNFAEIYGKVSYSVVSGALYYSNDFAGSGDGAFYLSGDLSVPAGPLSLNAHVGFSSGDGIESGYGNVGEDSYIDYGVGVGYSASNFTVDLKWVGKDFDTGGSDDRILISVSTSLPWAKE